MNDNTCEFCQRDNFNPDDDFCDPCRKLLGPDMVMSLLPGIQGSFDTATKALLKQLITIVPGWQEMMGQPLKGQISVEPIDSMNSPGMEITIQVRFQEQPPKPINTEGTK